MEQMELTGTPEPGKESIVTTTEAGANSDSRTFIQVLPAQMFAVHEFAWGCFFEMAGVTHGELEPDDYWDRIQKGLMQFFIYAEKGVPCLGVVTEFVQYPRFKILRIVGIAGKHAIRTKRFWPSFCQWATLNGAKGIETFATPETIKLDERLGMKPYVTLMRYYIEGNENDVR
jgi:hypothetical protein